MSAWFEVLGWLWIAMGVHTTWRDSRVLVFGPYRRSEQTREQRRARRQALTKLRFSLFWIAVGVTWVTGLSLHPVVAWLLGGCLVVWLTYDLSAWSRSRRRRKSGITA
jgi:hypothetical protein